MRTTILKRAWRAFGQALFVPQSRGAIVMVALLLAATNLFAATTVNWVSGGPNPDESGVGPLGAGYVDGDITLEAAYNTPCGIAADLSGNYLFVADYTNNAIRLLEFDINWTSTLFTLNGLNSVTNLFHHPIGVAIDSSYNLFVLNRGNGINGNVLEFAIDEDLFATLVATNAANLTNAAGIALDFSDNIYVTIKSNKVLKITSPGVSNVVATVTNAGASLQGIVVKYNGLLAVCDSGRNGIYLINPTSGAVTTNAGFNGAGDFINTVNNRDPISIAKFFQPTGVAETGDGSLIVTDFGNHRVKVVTSTSVTNLYGVTSNDWVYNSTNPMYFWPGFVDGTVVVPDKPGGVAARQPFGVTIAPDGSVYVTEDYYHIIRHVTGAGLKPPLYPPLAPEDLTATAGYGQVILTWKASASPSVTNYNIKRSTSSGGPYTNNIVGSTSATTYTDTNVADGTTYYYVVSAVSSTVGEGPNSLEANATPMFSPVPGNLTVTNFNFGPVILTWSMSAGATSYNVKRSTSANGPFTTIGSPASTSYTDTSALVGTMYYYVVSAVNGGGESANSLEVPYQPPFPPPPPPRIGWFDYEPNYLNDFLTVLHPVSIFIAHNDLLIAIDPTTNGVATYYITTNGPQPVLAVPSPTNGSTPPFYQDGLFFAQPLPVTTVPDLVIKAVNVGPGGSSPIVTAEFLFQVANPIITGENAAYFTVSDITTNVTLWYTIDGTNPTNAPPSIGPIAITNGNPVTLSLNASTNLLFQARAFRSGYQPSGIAVQSFSPDNFVPNSISFGFSSGEASSDFIASPGQTFYAPVTLSVLPNTQIYSLQFNMTVNSGGPNPGPAVTPGAFGFQSLLEKPIPGVSPVVYEHIPPLMFAAYATNPPPPSAITYLDGLPFVNLETTNLGLNLLAVGWLERFGKTNLYNTLSQDLITYSQAHDTMYPSAQYPGQIEVGGYSFFVPTNAAPYQTYQIQIGRPSATSDGIGAPGSAVFIYAPTNGSFTNGAINAIKNVTIGQRKYIVGDVYPFRWFNAGDFGSGNLVTYGNADVEQVFEAAIYELNSPAWQAPGSDFFDAMDSCCGTYVDLGHGYLEFNTLVSGAGALNPLFDGNDTMIDQIAFGDGQLDVCDVYVTFIRSEFSNHVCFQRFWTNGVRVAQIVPNIVSSAVSKSSSGVSKIAQQAGNTSVTNQPKVNFTAGDCQTNAGSTIQIPITANIFGNYPLRVLMINLSVIPLDGSPALTTPFQFTQNPVLGNPYFVTPYSTGEGNYANVWLNSGISGLSNNVSIGTLTVTIPANATSSSAYAVHFDHVSASPNGIASFPKQARTGLITLSNRSGSSWGDAIPDSWRLRYFLTLNNLLSATNADADGDGENNLQEYLAGTDPTDPTSFFKNIGTDPSAAQQPSDCVISWPSVSGKQYVIERSPSLSTPIWIPVSTNSGNGTIMEYQDSSGGGLRFYRVQVQ
jgi:hypothetical protein